MDFTDSNRKAGPVGVKPAERMWCHIRTQKKRGDNMQKASQINVNSIDVEKMIILIQTVMQKIDSDKKFQVVLTHDPQKGKDVIDIFKEA